IHERFTLLNVEGVDPGEILSEISRMTGLPVILESVGHQVLGYDAAAVPVRELLAEFHARSELVKGDGPTFFDRDSGWLVTVVSARGHTWGRLILQTGSE